MTHLTKEQAEKVFDIIVKYGAPTNLKDQFVSYVTSPEQWDKEFRFRGEFAGGGKLHVTRDGACVSFYPEDRTPERVARQAEVNAELAHIVPQGWRRNTSKS